MPLTVNHETPRFEGVAFSFCSSLEAIMLPAAFEIVYKSLCAH
jgi:hypothetical protein